ncbi:cupin domain-containing protein [Streptomyces sp. NPDC059396]|uniref:cupin domain-containing protein n=1 Tax=Streptomyces sp. NPDC059396 TaxID=3346819 RepID=UPI003694590F
MDVLSDAVAAMRTGIPHSKRNRFRAPWGIRFAPQEGAGFHVILQGSCALIPASGEAITLGVGDVAFLPRELGHAIADGPTTPLREATTGLLTAQAPADFRDPANPTDFRDPANPTDPGNPTGPGSPADPASGATTVMLCGAYRLDQSRAHPLLAELPDVVHLPAHVGQHPSLRGATDLLLRSVAEQTGYTSEYAFPEREHVQADRAAGNRLNMPVTMLQQDQRAWLCDGSGQRRRPL